MLREMFQKISGGFQERFRKEVRRTEVQAKITLEDIERRQEWAARALTLEEELYKIRRQEARDGR
jgi:hypothetical protein